MSDYLKLSPQLREAFRTGKGKLVVELYHPDVDDIFLEIDRAQFRFADTDLKWGMFKYEGKLKTVPDFDKFIGKEFNQMKFDLQNIERGINSPSFIVFNHVIKGFRVALRAICKGLPIADSWIVWSGRLDALEGLTPELVTIQCTQELGKFSYQIATDRYGTACPLRFGFRECLGNEKLEEKSDKYQQDFKMFGYGGCTHTFEACQNKGESKNGKGGQIRFYQGQREVVKGGIFNVVSYVKKRHWWSLFITTKKQVLTPVQWSPKNQDSNSNQVIPMGFGRVSIPGRVFTQADVGGTLIGLVGFMKAGRYGIDSAYGITSGDPTFPVAGYTLHLGELGGIGTQQPDNRFLDSGYNSKLVYAGVDISDLSDDPLSDKANEFPDVSGVFKANKVPVWDGEQFNIQWSNNGVWIARYLCSNFPFTVIKDSWWDEDKNLETATRNFRIVEDDTNSETAVITDNEVSNYNADLLERFHSAARYNAYYAERNRPQSFSSSQIGLKEFQQNLAAPVIDDPTSAQGDIDFYNVSQGNTNNLHKTFLQFQYTTNGVISESSSLSDVLYGLNFPSFRGYLAFTNKGRPYIGSRQQAPTAFVRVDWSSTENELDRIPITNVAALHNKGGKLLIGTGQVNGEIRVEKGVKYIHSPISVTASTVGGVTIAKTDFIAQNGAPSQATLTFGGTPQTGNRILISLSTPIVGEVEPRILQWDYFVDADDTAEVVAQMFKARLEASIIFEEFWTCRINRANPKQLILEYQVGFLLLDRPLTFSHYAGEEILRVVEVYENSKDLTSIKGQKDNIYSFELDTGTEQYQSVKATYISAIEDFAEVEILPYTSWAVVEDEREMNLQELDLRWVDNYWQASYLVKAIYIDSVIANLAAQLETVTLAMFHQEDDVIAVQYQTLEGAVSYLPMSVLSVKKAGDKVNLGLKLYLSAMFDRRVAKEEKRLESTLSSSSEPVPEIIVTQGGFSSTRTGDGASDAVQDILYKPKPYQVLPSSYHTDGSMRQITPTVLAEKQRVFDSDRILSSHRALSASIPSFTLDATPPEFPAPPYDPGEPAAPEAVYQYLFGYDTSVDNFQPIDEVNISVSGYQDINFEDLPDLSFVMYPAPDDVYLNGLQQIPGAGKTPTSTVYIYLYNLDWRIDYFVRLHSRDTSSTSWAITPDDGDVFEWDTSENGGGTGSMYDVPIPHPIDDTNPGMNRTIVLTMERSIPDGFPVLCGLEVFPAE